MYRSRYTVSSLKNGYWKFSRRYLSAKSSDPLHILFCGSDEFSIASLRSVFREHVERRGLVESIDVVCRPGKPTGRGLKVVREVPIKHVAQRELGLPVHEIDTFTGWNPPNSQGKAINLVIAVSFGLFVPPRILNGAKYGGLNVHPSLLPDLRGPAPLHHALLLGRKKTGITIQTLHPKHFDQGTILAQTPFPGIDIPNPERCTPSALLDFVAPLGARMLVESLRNKVFVPPIEDRGWYGEHSASGKLAHAPKISSEDKHINWNEWTAETVLRRNRVLGNLWDDSLYHTRFDRTAEKARRIIFHEWADVDDRSAQLLGNDMAEHGDEPGTPTVMAQGGPGAAELYFLTCDSPPRFLKARSCTIEGGRKGAGVDTLIALAQGKSR